LGRFEYLNDLQNRRIRKHFYEIYNQKQKFDILQTEINFKEHPILKAERER
jgi:hypothetical protein